MNFYTLLLFIFLTSSCANADEVVDLGTDGWTCPLNFQTTPLVDTNIPPQESDRQLAKFLATRGRPHLIVATKCDRLSGNELAQAMRKLGQAYPEVPIVPFSAKTGSGKEELWNQIRTAVENFSL